MVINNFNNTITTYLSNNQFNNTISSYLKTSDFNLTKSSLVDTVANQTIGGGKTFNNLVKLKGGSNLLGGEPSLQIMPKDGNVGQSFMEFHRYADGTIPAFGDRWLVGNDIESLNFIPIRSFSIWCSSSNARSPHIYITPTGQTVIPFGSLSSPPIHTNTLNINGTNINQLYQSKSDMGSYITSGSLVNYVNVNSSQTIGGEKNILKFNVS